MSTVDIPTPKMGPAVFIEVSLVTGGPLVPLEVVSKPVSMVTGGPRVTTEVFEDLVAMMTGGPVVPLEATRELVAVVLGGPLVPLEVSRELVAVVTGGPLVPSEVSRELVAVVTGGPLVPSEVSRELVVMVSPVTVCNPRELIPETAGVLAASEISRSMDFLLVETSWESTDLGRGRPLLAAMEIPGEDTSSAG